MTAIALTASLIFKSAAQDRAKLEKGLTALFNGKDLPVRPRPPENEDTFSIRDGAIVANGPRCHLYYSGSFGNHDFKNFELKVEQTTA